MHPLPLLAALAVSASPAVPPQLARYLEAARKENQTLAVTRARSDQAAAQARQALSALLPALELRGAYTRNQYDSSVRLSFAAGVPAEDLVITPINQLTASAALTVPLFDWSLIQRYSGARAGRDAARDSVEVDSATVALAVAEAYYQVVASQGLVAASDRALEAARANLELAQLRFDAGTVTSLDIERARVDVARAEQNRVATRRSLALSRRSLATLTGEPEPGDLPDPDPDPLPLPENSEQQQVDRGLARRAELSRQRALVRQAQSVRDGAWGTLLPALGASAQEVWSNSEGFVGQRSYWIAGLTLDWRLEILNPSASLDEGAALLREQRALLAQAELAVRDEVHRGWLDVEANLARVEQARIELTAAREALELARARYRAGSATSFELSQVLSDAFGAEANLVQARTELAYSLLALKRAAGEPLD